MTTRKKGVDLTVQEVADELGLAYDTVRRLILGSQLKAYKADQKQWRVTRASLDEFKASGGVRRPGRPAKEKGTE